MINHLLDLFEHMNKEYLNDIQSSYGHSHTNVSFPASFQDTGVYTEGGCVKFKSELNRTYLKYKFLVNVPLGDAWLKVRVLQKTQKKFINQLRRLEKREGAGLRHMQCKSESIQIKIY